MTDTTPKFDPIPRLQQIAETIRERGAYTFDAPATAAYYIDCAIKEIERLREEQEDTHALIERTGAILTATANALHGGYAPPDCLHSWHDLPELVEKLRKERDEAKEKINSTLTSSFDALRRERDEARRRVCEMSLQLGKVYRRVGGKTVEVTTPEGCAEIMRWDCYETPEPKVVKTLNGVVRDGGKAVPPQYHQDLG